MWLLKQDHDLTSQEKKVDDLMEVDVYNFLHMVSSVGGTNSNIACLGEEVNDLMEMDEGANCLI